jgi:DNA transformation protein
MTVSESYRTFVLEQIGRVIPRVRGKSMFGGVGVYSGDHFFALIDDDVLFFKVDDSTRHEFIAAGMKAWSPFGDDREMKGYYELPAELLEDPGELRPWVDKAVKVAAAKKLGNKKPKTKNAKRQTLNKTPRTKRKKPTTKPKPKKR